MPRRPTKVAAAPFSVFEDTESSESSHSPPLSTHSSLLDPNGGDALDTTPAGPANALAPGLQRYFRERGGLPFGDSHVFVKPPQRHGGGAGAVGVVEPTARTLVVPPPLPPPPSGLPRRRARSPAAGEAAAPTPPPPARLGDEEVAHMAGLRPVTAASAGSAAVDLLNTAYIPTLAVPQRARRAHGRRPLGGILGSRGTSASVTEARGGGGDGVHDAGAVVCRGSTAFGERYECAPAVSPPRGRWKEGEEGSVEDEVTDSDSDEDSDDEEGSAGDEAHVSVYWDAEGLPTTLAAERALAEPTSALPPPLRSHVYVEEGGRFLDHVAHAKLTADRAAAALAQQWKEERRRRRASRHGHDKRSPLTEGGGGGGESADSHSRRGRWPMRQEAPARHMDARRFRSVALAVVQYAHRVCVLLTALGCGAAVLTLIAAALPSVGADLMLASAGGQAGPAGVSSSASSTTTESHMNEHGAVRVRLDNLSCVVLALYRFDAPFFLFLSLALTVSSLVPLMWGWAEGQGRRRWWGSTLQPATSLTTRAPCTKAQGTCAGPGLPNATGRQQMETTEQKKDGPAGVPSTSAELNPLRGGGEGEGAGGGLSQMEYVMGDAYALPACLPDQLGFSAFHASERRRQAERAARRQQRHTHAHLRNQLALAASQPAPEEMALEGTWGGRRSFAAMGMATLGLRTGRESIGNSTSLGFSTVGPGGGYALERTSVAAAVAPLGKSVRWSQQLPALSHTGGSGVHRRRSRGSHLDVPGPTHRLHSRSSVLPSGPVPVASPQPSDAPLPYVSAVSIPTMDTTAGGGSSGGWGGGVFPPRGGDRATLDGGVSSSVHAWATTRRSLAAKLLGVERYVYGAEALLQPRLWCVVVCLAMSVVELALVDERGALEMLEIMTTPPSVADATEGEGLSAGAVRSTLLAVYVVRAALLLIAWVVDVVV